MSWGQQTTPSNLMGSRILFGMSEWSSFSLMNRLSYTRNRFVKYFWLWPNIWRRWRRRSLSSYLLLGILYFHKYQMTKMGLIPWQTFIKKSIGFKTMRQVVVEYLLSFLCSSSREVKKKHHHHPSIYTVPLLATRP